MGQLIDHGNSLIFEDQRCTIYDKGKEKLVMAKIKMTNRSFPLIVKYANKAFIRIQGKSNSWLLHKRFGHLNFHSLKLLRDQHMVESLPKIEEQEVCEGCAKGKHHRQPFPKGVAWRAKHVLELVHMDVRGPMNTPTNFDNMYLLFFIDDYSSMIWLIFMKQKSEVLGIFNKFKSFVENKNG